MSNVLDCFVTVDELVEAMGLTREPQFQQWDKRIDEIQARLVRQPINASRYMKMKRDLTRMVSTWAMDDRPYENKDVTIWEVLSGTGEDVDTSGHLAGVAW